ncbi:MAG: hypothetical protein J6M14_04105 [Campylobacter sp.]|nr:hypothetical protein [Campylobacter sp.]
MKKFYQVAFCASLAILAAGCSSHSVPGGNDASLPRVEGIKSISGTNEIGLEWPNYGSYPNLLGFVVYRADMGGGEAKKIATLADPYTTHFADTRLEPNTSYKYTVRAYGINGVGESSPAAIVSTTKTIDSVPFAQAYALPDRVKIIWRPHPDLRVASYTIERRVKGADSWSGVKDIAGRLSAEYIDYVNYTSGYEYRIIAKSQTGMLSLPSAPIQVSQMAE